MRQLIARIDDDLHTRLKRRAAEEGRSVNALVRDVLAGAVESRAPQDALRSRARAADLLVHPPRPKRVPSRGALERATKGAGHAASDALVTERSAR